MFARTHNPVAPWTVVLADNKHVARLQVIKDLLTRLQYADKDEDLVLPNPDAVYEYDEVYLNNGMIAT
jgi:hypothetical protein